MNLARKLKEGIGRGVVHLKKEVSKYAEYIMRRGIYSVMSFDFLPVGLFLV